MRGSTGSVRAGLAAAALVLVALGARRAYSDWNSGGFAPQELELDLGQPETISGMSLTVDQSPAGGTVHWIYAGADPHPTALVRVLAGYTSQGQVLQPTFQPVLTNIRYVRIRTTVSPSWVAWGPISFTQGTTVASPPPFKALSDPTVQQFGFYGCAMNGVGTGDYTNEVGAFSNVVWVRWSADDELVAKVQNARQQGLGVILMVQNLFFPWASSQLYTDEPGGPRKRFQAVWRLLQPYQSSIKGFYLFDEPFWNNSKTDGTWTTVPDADLKSNLTWVADELHAEAPSVPCITIFAYTEVGRPEFFSSLLPAAIDWVGFDDYLAYGDAGSDDKIRGYFDAFVRNKSSTQKIVLVPDAWWPTLPDAATDALVAQRVALYQGLAASSAEVVAIYPFLYQTDAVQNLYGAQSLPATMAVLTSWFQTLLGRAPLPAPAPTPAPPAPPPPAPPPPPSAAGLITATPDPATLGGASSTTVSWTSTDAPAAEVWLSYDGGAEVLFQKAPAGSARIMWSQSGTSYVFSLYAGPKPSALLSTVTARAP